MGLRPMDKTPFGIPEIDEFCKNHEDERVRIIGQRIREYRSKLARLTEAYQIRKTSKIEDLVKEIGIQRILAELILLCDTDEPYILKLKSDLEETLRQYEGRNG